MGTLRKKVITEQRVYDDPKHPETSAFDISFPLTITDAVVDAKSGKVLQKTLDEISKTANDAAIAVTKAQGTADEALETANMAKEVADGAAQAIAAVVHTISVTPSQAGSLTYNKVTQIPSWNNFMPEMMTLAYGEARTPDAEFKGETNAGAYKAYATPKEGYTWGDKSSSEREIPWTIQKAVIQSTPSVNGVLTYTGSAQSPSWLNYDSAQLTKTETAQTNAGTYSTAFTPKANYQWRSGDSLAVSVSWTIEKASVAPPTQSGSLTYTGVAQSPSWTGYDTTKMTVSGTTSGTNAGGYTATFELKANYQWSDGSTSAKVVAWSINKAANSLTISPTQIALPNAGETAVIAVTRAGDGVISATSNSTAVATVSASGGYAVVTGVAPGSATITVKVAEGSNYLAPANKTCAVTVEVPKIYGASWDGSSTTKWSRTDSAAGFIDPVPYLSGVSAYSSPFDNVQPWAGMVKSERTGGTMVAIPKFWYKLTQSGKSVKVQIANKATSGFSVAPVHMDRSDGKDERDVVYVGRYHCGASAYKSVTGQTPKNTITRSAARTAIHNLGANIWQTDFAMRFTIWLLYIVEFADWNSQAKIGYGCGNNSAPQGMGYTDGMPYHTGSTLSSRTAYGCGTQYRNIEGLWDNVLDWCDGCYYNSAGMNIILNPNSFSDSSGGTNIGTPSSGYPSAFTVSAAAGYPMFYASATGGSDVTYSCDYWSFSASDPCLYVGGNYHQYANRGFFCIGYSSTSDANTNFGCRLQELP